jgi:hypothetical protein
VSPVTTLYYAAARAALFAHGLFAWRRPPAARPARPPEPLTRERDAVHRWEDEGGNVK